MEGDSSRHAVGRLSRVRQWWSRARRRDRALLAIVAAQVAALVVVLVRANWAIIKPTIYPVFPWQALATALAALVALYTIDRTQRHNAEQLRAQREQFDRKLVEDRLLADRKARQDRELADRKARQDEFTDILNRFASRDNLAVRVNAALRLAALAQRDPLFPHPDGAPWPRTREHYPLFVDAATQLVAALRTEDTPEVVEAVGVGLANLAAFAADRPAGDREAPSATPGQPLLMRLLDELARANRAALLDAIRALADTGYTATDSAADPPADPPGRLLADLLRGQEDDEGTAATILDRWTTHPGFTLRQRHPTLDRAQVPTPTAHFARRTAQLRALQDALALALRHLAPLALDTENERRVSLDFAGCYLAFADLRRANLGRADLKRAKLVGANLVGAYLWRANLAWADLRRANLVGTNLRAVDLRGANLGGADLGRADMRGANLWAADLGRANLGTADLRRANLVWADLRRANLGEAYVGAAQLDEHTRIAGARWEEADFTFRDDPSREEDTALREQFRRLAVAQDDPRYAPPPAPPPDDTTPDES